MGSVYVAAYSNDQVMQLSFLASLIHFDDGGEDDNDGCGGGGGGDCARSSSVEPSPSSCPLKAYM
jgi:hypothetical protein